MAKRDPPPDVPPAPRPFGLAASAARFTRRFTPRAAALACGALVLSVCLFAYSGSHWVVVIYQLATDGALLAAWLLASLGLGAFLLRVFRLAEQDRSRVLLPVVTSIALGLGVLSLAALGLGLCGLLNRITALGLIGLGILLAVIAALSYRSRHRPGEVDAAVRAWLAAPAGWAWLWLAVMPLLAIAIVGAMVPPGALWTPDEPHGYDVVEYHLQVPREWYEAGKILPLPHNVFSYFPFGVEMHYLLAMHLSGGPWHGMYLAQMMHGAHVVLAVLAVYAIARTLSRSRASAVFAGVAAASVPWLTLLAPIAYNEGALLLYGTLAVGWSLRAAESSEARLQKLVLAGVMAGFACGAKLTAVPLVLVGIPAALLVEALLGRRLRVGAATSGSLAFILAGMLVFSPWLIRNKVWAGNPLFPEGATLLGRAHFTEVQVERWHRANHSPGAEYASAAGRMKAFGLQVWGDSRFAYVLLPLAVVSLYFARRRDPGWWLLVSLFVELSVFWLALTHLQGRFFVLAIPIAALIVCRLEWGRWAWLGIGVSVVACIIGWYSVHNMFASRMFGPRGWAGVIGVPGEAFDELPVHPLELQAMPTDATLTLIGEARAFWFPREMKRLRYRTVFDVDTTGSGDVIEAWRRPPVANEWLLIDPGELTRFSKTYFGIPPPPAEAEAKAEPYVVAPAP